MLIARVTGFGECSVSGVWNDRCFRDVLGCPAKLETG